MRTALLGALVMVALLTGASPVAAQEADQASLQALRAELEELKQQVTALEAKVAALEGAVPSPTTPPAGPAQGAPTPTAEVPAGAAGAGGPTGALPIYGGVAAASKIFNPDMAVIGDFLGAGGTNRVDPLPAVEMHESEASFQAIVDPYARADFFVSFGEEGVELEEGYMTFPAIPGGLLFKVGKIRSAFGKVNTLHNHLLPWTDRPVVINNLLGGEEGIGDAGLSVARLVPNPWLFLEVTGQAYRGDSGDVFRSSKRGDLSYVGHLRGYQDITESSNIDLGFSYAQGHNEAGSEFLTQLYGVDATFRYRPLRRSIYRSFVGRSEVIWSRRDQSDGRQDASGFFASGDYQFARRWFAGARYDRAGRPEGNSLRDTGQALVLTYWPSEFSQVRGQYRRLRYAEDQTANEFLFQFQFSIGAHGAHPF